MGGWGVGGLGGWEAGRRARCEPCSRPVGAPGSGLACGLRTPGGVEASRCLSAATLEHLMEARKCLTLFVTHYPEVGLLGFWELPLFGTADPEAWLGWTSGWELGLLGVGTVGSWDGCWEAATCSAHRSPGSVRPCS